MELSTGQLAEVKTAGDVLEAAGELTGAARCERARAWVAWSLCKAPAAHAAYRNSRELLRRAGSTAFERELTISIQRTAMFSGIPADEMRRMLDDLHAGSDDAGPLRAATARAARARLEFMAGAIELDDVWPAIGEEITLLQQTGSELGVIWSFGFRCFATWLTSDDEAVELQQRERVLACEAPGSAGSMFLANCLADWALTLCRLGDVDAARDAVARGRATAQAEDVGDQILLDLADAFVHAMTAEAEDARSLLHSARRRASGIEMTLVTDQVDYVEAGIAALLGDEARARTRLAELVERAEARGQRPLADRYRRDLHALG